MKKNLIILMLIPAIALLVLAGCKKDKNTSTGTIKLGLTDTRSSQLKADLGIIDASKLTKFELNISQIEFITADGGTISATSEPITIDLRDYQGTIKDLVTVQIPYGSYQGIYLTLSGITITYDGNTYSSIEGTGTSLVFANYPGVTITTGIPTPFATKLFFPMLFNFDLIEADGQRNLNLAIDAVGSCGEIAYTCASCGGGSTINFAGLRINNIPFFYYFEDGIQQISCSPPLGIELNSGTTASYDCEHTFVDFDGIGGTINSDSTQHIYRGEDGSQNVEAEDMAINSSALSTTTISATGKTTVTAHEVFNFSAINTNLSAKGINLVAGKKYYFSLKKTWKITSGIYVFQITRFSESIPVTWPTL
jgi:hypothetical protein